jgi:AcrR family transcriptional regulator
VTYDTLQCVDGHSRKRARSSSPRPARSRAPRTSETDGGSRAERKRRTREALIAAAFRMLERHSFDRLSLREVAREAGVVPTAFYRHFENMDALGLVLVDESFRTLRDLLRDARTGALEPERIIRSSVQILVRHTHEHRQQFRFIARERYSGVTTLRYAIRSEIRLFASELATDLARFPGLNRWTTEDLNMMAGLIVNTMVSTVEGILDAPLDSPVAEDEIIRIAEKQLILVALGAAQWRVID